MKFQANIIFLLECRFYLRMHVDGEKRKKKDEKKHKCDSARIDIPIAEKEKEDERI